MGRTLQFIRQKYWLAFASTMALVLSACGGGGSSGSVAANSAATGTQANSGCEITYLAEALPVEATGPDPLANNLWHLKNSGQIRGSVAGEDLNVESAWAISTGANVTIAIVDDALETVHVDLAKNINIGAGLDYRGGLPNAAKQGAGLPCHTSDYHGTAVAGIIAARSSNGVGTTGVAPHATLVGYSALTGDDDLAAADALTRDLQSNAIYNSSWGAADTGELWEAGDHFNRAIQLGLTEGRAGKGAIYVFPAGNGGCALRSDLGQCQAELSSYDGYLNAPGVIVVSAYDKAGKIPYYGESGPNVLVSAPGGDSTVGITTTALKSKFSETFAGTSASTPMVSGVAALMLSANQKLTWRDVRLILAKTARKINPNDSAWFQTPAGLWFNPKYGFGAVDALAAVKAAQSWVSVGGSQELKSCEVVVNSGAAIADAGAALLLPLTLGANCAISSIEHVQLQIDATHDYSGDLEIRLVSPGNSVSQLALARTCGDKTRAQDDCGSYSAWNFASVQHMNESPSGVWGLQLKDKVPGKTGTLQFAKLTIFGR